MSESSRVPRIPKAGMTKSSRVPRVPEEAETTAIHWYWYSDDLFKCLVLTRIKQQTQQQFTPQNVFSTVTVRYRITRTGDKIKHAETNFRADSPNQGEQNLVALKIHRQDFLIDCCIARRLRIPRSRENRLRNSSECSLACNAGT